MKKVLVLAVCASLLVSSCDTYAGAGAYAGSTLGSILGSAIGGISDGPRGSDIGTIIGMAGGAVIGGAIGNATDQAKQRDYDQYQYDRARRQAERNRQSQGSVEGTHDQDRYGSGYDGTNSGDDRLYDFNGSDYTGNYSAQQPTTAMPSASSVEDLASSLSYTPALEIRNARFVDDNQDKVLNAGEVCKVIFEVYNRGNQALYDIQPTVVETTGNRHIFISPSIHVEKLMPGKGIRYTAIVKADNRLKKGMAKICASVVQGNKAISKVSEFDVPTSAR
ncbi:MAG: hypothetical protein LKK01_01745 [Prevotella sp.]|jgi:uncharacterized protein YcfJ|nr:hypothetical protein [Prevotella sp.]MCI2101340.1 hypothetical protein [Prevotella sp.]